MPLPTRVYRVAWLIDLEAESPEQAAQIAQNIQRDPNSIATCFVVQTETHEWQIDLKGTPNVH
jgi:hypothetical protein